MCIHIHKTEEMEMKSLHLTTDIKNFKMLNSLYYNVVES